MTMDRYEQFLASKTTAVEANGTTPMTLHESLFPFQSDIVRWAVRLGRAAIFADCGLGKTRMLLEWARHWDNALIVSPLAAIQQTIEEGAAIGVHVERITERCAPAGIHITNYERLARHVGVEYDAIVLDESSILKSVDGRTRTMLLEEFTSIPHRLCCTATPAPNDVTELANHAEFIGAMARTEMLATYFVHDSDESSSGGWRLKGHARNAMYEWMATWATYIREPADLGYENGRFTLPALRIRDVSVPTEWCPDGQLIPTGIGGVSDRAKVRRYTMADRVTAASDIIGATDDQWIVWCGLNDEGRAMARALGDAAVLVEGSDKEADKLAREQRWRAGAVRVLISKPSIFGFGMNWQHCHRVLFLGLGDSWESYYQAIRRCWRFGQQSPVDVSIVVSSVEGQISANVKRKEHIAQEMAAGVIDAMRDVQRENVRGTKRKRDTYAMSRMEGNGWELLLGDCVERAREVADDSVALSVFSPPFASLYTYSSSDRDMGNSADYDQFFEHFRFLVPELRRAAMPGRRCAVHVQQVATTKITHGVIGWRDFRADVVREFVAGGWVYDGEVVIDKCPQAQAIRTKSKQLMFVQKERDSAWLRPAMADYILCFRDPRENPVPVKSDITNEEWILWARPIWYGIRESDTLQAARARDPNDEKHVCPLQFETIERCVRLWTNPGELVFSPFAGIGSEGYVALKHDREFVGIELKRSYYDIACDNLRAAKAQLSLFGDA